MGETVRLKAWPKPILDAAGKPKPHSLAATQAVENEQLAAARAAVWEQRRQQAAEKRAKSSVEKAGKDEGKEPE